MKINLPAQRKKMKTIDVAYSTSTIFHFRLF